uniref:Exonuclease domain-containing protein n=1 Tax=viral metagenome TaxID=1070528 RepID=A0A6C0KMB5_9ZZZZ
MTTNILVFDVETTGLLPRQISNLAECPHILQLSYLVYDGAKIVKKYNTYVRVSEQITITPEITNMTGITREKCNGGVPILDALWTMYADYVMCGCVVAHNIEFDTKMIQVELERHHAPAELRKLMNLGFEKAINIRRYCTMMNSIELCAIKTTGKNKKGEPYEYNKWPRLSELHAHLFGFVPDGLHDAMVDVEACLKCYILMHG